LQENESYPAQLEKLWNERNPERPIEVLNLGYPGTNSFRIAENLDQVLSNFKPEVVLLTVGVNDMFTASENILADEKGDSAFWDPDERMGQVWNFKLANSDKTVATAQPDELITFGGRKIVMN